MTNTADTTESTMREVTKDEFFATVGQMAVHPRPERDVTFWETPRRQLLGKTFPGYMCDGPKRYFVTKDGGR